MKFLPLTLLALAASAVAPAQSPTPVQPQRIDIAMTRDGFVPRTIGIRSGAPVIMRVTNRTGTGHNLTQEVFFREARLSLRDRALVPGGKIPLSPGQRVVIRFTAPLNRPGATYQFSSTVLGDAASDYKGVFVIR